MTLTRWKMLAGLLGLSLAGVAATADPPCPAKTAGRTVHVNQSSCSGPIGTAPPLPVVVTTAELAIPVAAPTEAVRVGFQPAVEIAAPTPAPLPAVTPAEPAKAEPAPVPDLPKLDLTLPPVTPVGATAPAGKPPELPPPAAPVPAPTLTGPASTPPAVNPEPPPPQRLDPPAVPTAKSAAPPDAPAVRVVLKLGDGQPRCEVLTGDDTLLKVVSDKVDVTSPSAKGENFSALRAAGAVRFSAPGCEGTCNELTVLPGSGDVELAGDVRVRCKQGKGETRIEAGKMRFKLGSAPAYTVSDPDGGTVNAAHTTPAKR